MTADSDFIKMSMSVGFEETLATLPNSRSIPSTNGNRNQKSWDLTAKQNKLSAKWGVSRVGRGGRKLHLPAVFGSFLSAQG